MGVQRSRSTSTSARLRVGLRGRQDYIPFITFDLPPKVFAEPMSEEHAHTPGEASHQYKTNLLKSSSAGVKETRRCENAAEALKPHQRGQLQAFRASSLNASQPPRCISVSTGYTGNAVPQFHAAIIRCKFERRSSSLT